LLALALDADRSNRTTRHRPVPPLRPDARQARKIQLGHADFACHQAESGPECV